ncbi:hypothetical protein [Nitrosopumilus sp. b1]|uniref:hypothetical protein n=1 Tax=Nitrosopumilus sp. b1 TaxID=2109907 RepID=UPI0015F53926|nr:hypothetical protein [Nitrosopumilus sp. b1]
MGIRATIVIDESNMEKLRNLQSKMIRTSTKSISFSNVVNQVIEEGLKRFKP